LGTVITGGAKQSKLVHRFSGLLRRSAARNDDPIHKVFLKPRQIRKPQLPAMHMHAAELGAAVERGKDFSGI
jgi:hypothetical protein